VYARLGGMVARTTGLGTSNYGVSPLAAVGLEYPFSPHWAGRLEYQWTHNVGNSNTVGVRADNHLVSIGLLYRFGGALAAAPAPVQPTPPMVAPPPAPAAPMAPREFNLNSDVLFDFNKSQLKPSGVSALNTLLSQLQAQTPRDANINVLGYTDRLGSESYNLGLSQRRAQTVAAYLTSHGIPASRVSSEGRGKADPVTAGRCDGIKKRPALIQCLSPDRRVVVRVTGTSAAQ
jgi:OOP family OmpA-OmpF porin